MRRARREIDIYEAHIILEKKPASSLNQRKAL
jgi:hypothetical protein